MIADKRIIYTAADGSTSIVIPSPEWGGTMAELAAHLGLTEYTESDVSAIPSDRTFRNAWKADLSTDIAKAKNILRDKIRAIRAPILADLDAEYMRADEADDNTKKTTVRNKKQVLRDAPAAPAIDAAATPEQLKSAWPVDILGVAPWMK